MKYKEAEYLLYNYKAFKISVINLNNEISMLNSDLARDAQGIDYSREQLGGGGMQTSSVEQIAFKISGDIDDLTDKIEKLNFNVSRIEKSLEALSETEKNIITKRYFQGKEWLLIAAETNYHESSCRRIKNDAMRKIIIALFGQ